MDSKYLTGKWHDAAIAKSKLAVVPAPATDPSTPNLDTPNQGIPELASFNRVKPQPKLIYAARVQDGHSDGEGKLYDAMWQAGRSHPAAGEGNRVITAGYRVLGSMAGGMTVNNVRHNLEWLIRKLAVHRYAAGQPGDLTGGVYIVYSYASILRLRREAGLTHIIRRTRKVVFVDPNTGIPLLADPALNAGIPLLDTEKCNSGIPNLDTQYRQKSKEAIEAEARRVLADPTAAENLRTAARSVLGQE